MDTTYLQTQCPAVNIQRSLITVPPQKCPPRLVKLTMYGVSPGNELSPPTIRLSRDLITQFLFDTVDKS